MARSRRTPTSIRLDPKLKAVLQQEASRQRRLGGVSEMIQVILHEWVGRQRLRQVRVRKPRSETEGVQ